MRDYSSYSWTALANDSNTYIARHKHRLVYVVPLLFVLITVLAISDWFHINSDGPSVSIDNDHLITSNSSISTAQPSIEDVREFQRYACSSHQLNYQFPSSPKQPPYKTWTPLPTIPTTVSLLPGQPFCVRVFIQSSIKSAPSTNSTFRPIPGYDIDSIEIHARGKSIFIPFDVNAVKSDQQQYRIYEADIRLYDEDEYELSGTVEYINGEWNLDYKGIQDYYLGWPLFNDTVTSIKIRSDAKRLFTDKEYIPLKEYSRMPICENGNHTGRWIPKNLLPSEYKEHLPPLQGTKNELVWVPYNCRYKPYTPEMFMQCVSKQYPKGIQWFGDSNSRRSVKKLVSNGTWCAYPIPQKNQQSCDCEDWRDESTRKYFSAWSTCNFKFRIGNVPVNMDFIGGLTGTMCSRKKPSQGVEMLLKEISGFNGKPNSSAPLTRMEKLSLLFVGIVNWDAAKLPVNAFQKELDTFAGYFASVYDDLEKEKSPGMILRSGQFFCCTKPGGGRLYTRKRLAAYNDLYFEKFGEKIPLDLGRWDTYLLLRMRERRDIVQQFTSCPSAHAATAIVDVENQVLMNLMCNENSVLRRK